jgi:predicted RNase H-like HicB family nuclease
MVKYTFWQDESLWIGYLEEYPDYWTQGTSLEDLEEHLKDLYKDLSDGAIPQRRKVSHLANV